MTKLFTDIWQNVYLRFLLLVIALILIVLLLLKAQVAVISVIAAFLIAYLLDPFVSLIARVSNRALGLIVVIVISILAVALLWLLGIRVAAQLSSFAARIPSIVDQLEGTPYLIARAIDPRFGNLFEQVYLNVQTLVLALTEDVLLRLEGVGGNEPQLYSQLIAIGGNGFQVAIILVLAAYFIYNFRAYSQSFIQLFPMRHRNLVEDLFAKAGRSVGDYLRAQLLISVIVGVLSFIGLSLIGLPLAAALGVIATVANLIPFLGPLITAIPALFLAFTVSPSLVLWTALTLIVINQLDAHIISPLIFSRVNELDPVTVIVSILLGAAFFGLAGALLAVPVAAFVTTLYKEYYLKSPWYKEASGQA